MASSINQGEFRSWVIKKPTTIPGKIASGKELTFSAPSRVLDIVSSESLKVKAMLLQPYPETQAPKDKKDYYIILDVSGL